MKRLLFSAIALAAILPAPAQVMVNREKFPDYSSATNPDPSLMRYNANAVQPLSERPDHVHNGLSIHFPPVFNQSGGSCGSASRICYMFSYELAAFRNLDASLPENYYPSHFVWLWTNGNCGKDYFVQHIGVPNAKTYGGQTYSSRFGYQDCADNDFAWTSGYDVWYSAMFNRMLAPTNFSAHLGTPEGREAVKNYLWNHNGDPDFRGVGGIVGLGVASGGDWQKIPQTAANDAAGVTGMYYVNHWGQSVDHALTLVGYDDRIEFDLNGNGIFGEESADEKGAWIIVNSWGNGWCNGGFIYCPYAYAGANSIQDADGNWSFPGNWWAPEIYTVRKNYRPLRTIRIKMDYSHRSEIALSAGVTDDLSATAPETTTNMQQFHYSGDGGNGDVKPAPEIPMQGRWADGELHTDPIEIGYDLTDLSSGLDRSKPLKYFFIIDSRSWAKGSGHIYETSIIDYEDDPEGVEIPFALGDESMVEVRNAGKQTIISVIVPGQQYYAPVNAAISGSILSWSAPQKSIRALTGYAVGKDGRRLATLGANVRSHNISTYGDGVYSVTAIYEGNHESKAITAHTPVKAAEPVKSVKLDNSGFTIPEIFSKKYDQATIEYWIKPATVSNWNQSVGSWGSFMFHANSNGTMTAGWNTGSNQRVTSETAVLTPGKWSHVAIVVDGNRVRILADDKQKGSILGSKTGPRGIGGFGNLVFGTSSESNHMNGEIAEIRIWDRAFTLAQWREIAPYEFSGDLLPDNLIAYYKGDTFNDGGTEYLRDCVGGYHAPLFASGVSAQTPSDLPLQQPEGDPAVAFSIPEGIQANIPATLSLVRNAAAQSVVWNIPGTDITDLRSPSANVVFSKAGSYTASVTATNAAGKSITADTTFTVTATDAPAADFRFSKTDGALGERISTNVLNPREDYSYAWQMPGAEPSASNAPATAFVYSVPGEYNVTLTVTAADGRSAKTTRKITINAKAPEADFTVSPAVIVKGQTTRIENTSKWQPETYSWAVTSPSASYIGTLRNLDFTPAQPGVYDISLTAANSVGSNTKTSSRALIVTNADSRNGLNFTPQGASVSCAKALSTDKLEDLTIDWWMNPSKLTNFCQGLGCDEFKIKVSANGAVIVSNGTTEIYTKDGCVIPNQWHHYAISFASGNVRAYRDGQFIQNLGKLGSVRDLGTLEGFGIGTTDAPWSGAIDELRVWNRRIESTTDMRKEKLQFYANRPLEGDVLAQAKADGLILYYDFNQSGGDVTDRSGNGVTGTRIGFGPEGDAWGLSQGVFCLNFEESENQDVTSQYLTNYKAPFSSSGRVNGTSSRWTALKDWTIENNTVSEDSTVTTGAHVDSQKDKCMTFTTEWDNFGQKLINHKVFQTVTLPAGMYTFTQTYSTKHVNDDHTSYLVVAPGKVIPDTDELPQSGARYTQMLPRGETADGSNSIIFVVEEPMEMSLGILFNMNGKKCVTVDRFHLLRSEVNVITTGDDEGSIEEIGANNPAARPGIYDLQGRRLERTSAPGVYIINGRKVLVR